MRMLSKDEQATVLIHSEPFTTASCFPFDKVAVNDNGTQFKNDLIKALSYFLNTYYTC